MSQENDNVLFQVLVRINHGLQKETKHCTRNHDACVRACVYSFYTYVCVKGAGPGRRYIKLNAMRTESGYHCASFLVSTFL